MYNLVMKHNAPMIGKRKGVVDNWVSLDRFETMAEAYEEMMRLIEVYSEHALNPQVEVNQKTSDYAKYTLYTGKVWEEFDIPEHYTFYIKNIYDID